MIEITRLNRYTSKSEFNNLEYREKLQEKRRVRSPSTHVGSTRHSIGYLLCGGGGVPAGDSTQHVSTNQARLPRGARKTV